MDYGFVLVAGESVEFVNDDCAPLLFIAVFDHLLKGNSVVGRARNGSVDIGFDDQKIVLFCILVTHSELTFDRLFGLCVRRVSCVDNCDIFLWTLKPVNVKINI